MALAMAWADFLRKAAPTVNRVACYQATQGFTIAPDLRRIC